MDLLTEFFVEFGVPRKFKNELKLKSQIIDLDIEFIETKDAYLLNSINALEAQLLKKQADNIDEVNGIDEDAEMKRQIARVGQLFGRPIDPRNITVLEFYTQLNYNEANNY